MSSQTITSNEIKCPNCKAVVKMDNSSQAPSFCLHCRFPVMLIAGKYRLIKVLGEGGCGTVYEATHERLTHDPRRVIKILKPELLKEESMRARFAREVQVTSAISQKNHHIVRIYDDFGEIPNLGPFYVMEYLEGQPLSLFLSDSKELLPLEKCYHFFEQLCTAMHDAHNEGIIHRDLKPDNLYIVKHLRNPHHLKVFDFGIAKPLVPEKEITNISNGMLGTPAYMAPEQLSHEISSHVDIYAMGVILYEMLVGHTPFSASDGSQRSAAELIAAKIMETPPSVLEVTPSERELPPELSKVVDKILKRKPEERYQSVEELEQAFHQAIEQAAPIILKPKSPASSLNELPTGGGPAASPLLSLKNLKSTLPYALDLDSLSSDLAILEESKTNTPQSMLQYPEKSTIDARKAQIKEVYSNFYEQDAKEAHTLDSYEPTPQDFSFEDEALAPTLDAPLTSEVLNRVLPLHPSQSKISTPPTSPARKVKQSLKVQELQIPQPKQTKPKSRKSLWPWFLLVALLAGTGGYFTWPLFQHKVAIVPQEPIVPLQPRVQKNPELRSGSQPDSVQPKKSIEPPRKAQHKRRKVLHKQHRHLTKKTRKKWGRLVPKCPQNKRFYWLHLRIKRSRSFTYKLEMFAQSATFKKNRTGYCVGIKTKRGKVIIKARDSHKKNFTCAFSIYGQPPSLFANFSKAKSKTKLPLDFCIK